MQIHSAILPPTHSIALQAVGARFSLDAASHEVATYTSVELMITPASILQHQRKSHSTDMQYFVEWRTRPLVEILNGFPFQIFLHHLPKNLLDIRQPSLPRKQRVPSFCTLSLTRRQSRTRHFRTKCDCHAWQLQGCKLQHTEGRRI